MGTLTITGTTLSGNNALYGGGVANNVGTLTLINNTLSGNSAMGWGGGIYNRGTIYNMVTLDIKNSTLLGNSAVYGGGISNDLGTLTLTNDKLSGNIAEAGGGIYHYQGTLYITNSTLSGNSASNLGGGIENGDVLTITNSTLSSNSAGTEGGGILNNGTLTLSNSTVSGNTSLYSSGGGINNSASSAILHNSILAGNTSLGPGPDCYGAISGAGYNLIGNTAGCNIIGNPTGNITGMDPLLGPLQDNGGPTPTQALLPGSPAINAGNPAGCKDHLGNPLNFDQRGIPRIGLCDIGAYEYDHFQEVYLPVILKPCPPLYDDFSNPASGWFVGDDGKNRYEYVSGEYRILVRPIQWGAVVDPGFQASGYAVSVNLRNPNGVDGSYGIAFGVAGDSSTFYTLEIYPDGGYGIYRYDPTGLTPLLRHSRQLSIRAAQATRSRSSELEQPSTPMLMANYWQALQMALTQALSTLG